MREGAREPRVDVSLALPEEQAIVERLLQLYIHDLSEYFAVAVQDDGRFDYPRLDLYWSEAGRYPFLIRVEKELAGFALVRKLDLPDGDAVWDIAEFFILRKHRRNGAGTRAAQAIWKRLPGRWQVRVLQANDSAMQFWRHAIGGLTEGAFGLASLEAGGASWQVFSFVSRESANHAAS